MRLVFLDTGPLGLLAKAPGGPHPDRCRRWVAGLLSAGVRVFVPEIADFEVRRKLLHLGATAGVRRLDLLGGTLDYAPITTDVMRRAAGLWADLRRAGVPTAAPGSLDGDVILAAQALLSAGPGDSVTVATDNVGHLARFPGLDARRWETVTG
jgi:predicted nucleic acid-binding protein